ncbi:MAG TPA: FHA domain-containing protein [Thermoanaerobaculia bacterium]|nr:FHA domain-containing protein [Thermoanaerobaculia bacterium]
MLDAIRDIATQAIEELSRIKAEQEVLEERLQAMDDKRGAVSDAVYSRVRGDYTSRHDALEQEARPLKEQARGEFAKLQALYEGIETARADARLEKEEVEFRHELGEFADEEYEERAESCAKALEEREAELAQVEELRQRFFAAFHSPQELTEGVERVAAGAAEGAAVAEAVAAEAEAEAPELAEPEGAAGGTELEEPEEPDDVGATGLFDTSVDEPEEVVVPEPPAAGGVWSEQPLDAAAEEPEEAWQTAATGSFEAVPPPRPAPGAPAADTADLSAASAAASGDEGDEAYDPTGATRILRRPRMIELEGPDGAQEYELGVGVTTIGRSSDNGIHLLEEAISRRHAEVLPGPDGFLIRDLGSENGTYVNGERVGERVLRDGDEVQIGARKLTYREA